MRQHRSRCASRLRAPLVTCLGLAVSLSAGLAQDVQKLAQVNIAQVVPPGPRAGPAARPGAQLQPGIRHSIEPWNAEPKLQPGIRIEPWNAEPKLQPGIRIEPWNAEPKLQPGVRHSIEPWNAEPKLQPGARPGEDLRRSPDPRPTEAPLKKPAGAGAGPKEASERFPIPPPPLPPSGLGLVPPLGLVGLGALGLSLAAVGLWLIKRRGAVQQTTVATPTAGTAATTDGKEGPTVSDIVNAACSHRRVSREAPSSRCRPTFTSSKTS
jgi:hypothetical protein